ncbi:MAG: tetratricopeptide repeat-containing glycosyltransferase family 2 protein [Planctomycetota bacterium]|jgi:tetratricopeptide (TPR) repeat protein
MTSATHKGRRPRLSVAIIVRDEQPLLAASIESVRPIADEIVVLDTGSTDRTVAVAEQLGAVVGRAAWNDDFAAARNRCLEQATGDWILWLDAGERLDEDAAEELRHFVDREANPEKVYMLWVEQPPSEQAVCREQVAQLRLVPTGADLRFEGRVRETLRPSIEAAGLGIDAAVGRIRCHARRHDPDRKASQAQRNLKLAELDAAEAEDRPPARLQLVIGEAHSNLGAIDEARRAFLAAVEAAEHGSTEQLEAYYGLLTTYDGQQSEGGQQLSTCLEALEVFPLDAQLLLAMGNYLQARNRTDLAVRSFEAAVKHGQVDLEVWHLAELPEVAADYLNLSLQIQGEDDRAREVLEEALQRTPDSTRLRRRLLELHVKHGRSDEALDLADRLPIEAEGREPLRDTIRGACKAAEQDWTAALGYLQSAYVAGCRDPLCLRWLSVTLLSGGQVEAARPVLAEWNKLEPTNAEVRAYLSALEQPPESAPQEKQPSEAEPQADSAGRQFRIDQGAPGQRAAPPQSSTISQTPAADRPAGPEA